MKQFSAITSIQQLQPYSTRVKMRYEEGFEQWFLLTTDHHWDNPKTKRKLLEQHHKQAAQRRAGIFSFGDLFCAMQGAYDPRKSKSDIRPEHNKSNYLDSLVETAIDWYAPYAHNYIVMSCGNHETSILKRQETNLTKRHVDGLNLTTGSNIVNGTYSGWILFQFEHKAGGNGRTKKLFYHHGYGGGGAVTKGVIQVSRKAVYIPDANFVVSGHVHEAWNLEICRDRITSKGRAYNDTQTHICCPTYKEEYQKHSGYHVQNGRPPKPLGAWWLRFYLENDKIKHQIIRAD